MCFFLVVLPFHLCTVCFFFVYLHRIQTLPNLLIIYAMNSNTVNSQNLDTNPDNVMVGNATVRPVKPLQSSRNKRNGLPWSLVVAVAVVLSFSLLAFVSPKGSDGNCKGEARVCKNKPVNDPTDYYQMIIGNVGLNLGMTIDDIRYANPSASISGLMFTPEIDEIAFFVPSIPYYVINGNIVAMMFDERGWDSERIMSSMITWSSLYVTSRQCSVGSTFGSVVRNYPNAVLTWENGVYDFRTKSYESFFCLMDRSAGINFYFSESKFTSKQLAVLRNMVDSGFESVIEMENIPYDVFESICSSVRVRQIEVYSPQY